MFTVEEIKSLERELEANPDLDEEFESCPSFYASATRIHAQAQDMVRRLEEDLDCVFSSLYAEYRTDHSNAKENDCKAYIRANQGYKEIVENLHKYKYLADLAKGLVRAWEIKRDMLIQRGAENRQGIDSYKLGSPASNKKIPSKARRKKAAKTVRSIRKENENG